MKATLDFAQLGIQFTEKQSRWVSSLVPNSALIGGFGSGKTMPFCIKALVLSILNGAGYSGLLVSPTHEMFARTLLPTLRDDIMVNLTMGGTGQTLWDASHFSISKKELTLPWGFTYYFGSADVPMRLRGMNLAVCGVDEATLIKDFPQLVISLSSRLRKAKTRPDGGVYSQLFVDGTPEGLDSVYEKFCIPPEDPGQRGMWSETHEIFRIATIENPGVPKSYIDNLMLGLSEEQIRSYIYGEHVDVGRGLSYYNFNEESNVRREAVYDPNLDLHISWDFNLSPMSMSVSQVVGKGLLKTIDEISIRNSNTPEVCREFIRRYANQGVKHRRRLFVYGDASAKVGTSQYDEIEDWIRPAFPGAVQRRVPSANPKHSSRLKAVNGLLRNARGSVRWIINGKCRNLIRDLRLQRMDEKNQSKDKRQMSGDGTTLGHMSDTTDYLIDYVFPYRRIPGRKAHEKTAMMDWMEA